MEDFDEQQQLGFFDSSIPTSSCSVTIPMARNGHGVAIQIRDSHPDIATAIIRLLEGHTDFCLFADRATRPFFGYTGKKPVSVTFLRKVIKKQGIMHTIVVDTSQGAI